MDENIADFLQRHTILIVVLFFLIFFGSISGILLMPPIYQVTAQIQVERRGTEIENMDLFYEQTTTQVSNVVQKLKSATLLQKTLNKLNYPYSIESRKFADIRKNIVVKSILPSNVIQISFKYNSPTEAARILNTLVTTLMEENSNVHTAKIDEAIKYVNLSLAQIREQQFQYQQPVRLNGSLDNRKPISLLKELDGELQKTGQSLISYKSAIYPVQKEIIEATFTSQLFERLNPALISLEKKMVADLLKTSENSTLVQQDQQAILLEKMRMSDIFKTTLNEELDVSKVKNVDQICAYQVKLYDLQIRRRELQNIISNSSTESEVYPEQAITLKELEDKLIKKLTELQNMKEPSFTEITWIDKAVALPDPYFPPNILVIVGLSFGVAFLTSLIVLVVSVEIKSKESS